jgi:hypothetical protein
MIPTATAQAAEWQSLPAPRGTTILLLTKWGVACKGIYYDEGQFIAWTPLPTVPGHIKALMSAQ